jgi:hypothetical protein
LQRDAPESYRLLPGAGPDVQRRVWLRFTGRNLEQELAVPWSSADVHPEDRSACLAAYDRHLPTPSSRTSIAQDGRGEYRWIEEVAVPRFGPTGSYGGHVGCCVDVTERRAQAERLFSALREKEVLLVEVHHRVKNNLAIIASLLSLQSEATEDLSVREVLAESEGRGGSWPSSPRCSTSARRGRGRAHGLRRRRGPARGDRSGPDALAQAPAGAAPRAATPGHADPRHGPRRHALRAALPARDWNRGEQAPLSGVAQCSPDHDLVEWRREPAPAIPGE